MRYKLLFVLALTLSCCIASAEDSPATQPIASVASLSQQIDALVADNRALREEVKQLRAAAGVPWSLADANALESQLMKIGASVRKSYQEDEEKSWHSKVTVGWPRIDIERSNSILYPLKGAITYSETVDERGVRQICVVTLVVGLRDSRWWCMAANRHTEGLFFGTKPQPSDSVNGDQDVTMDFESRVSKAMQEFIAEAAKAEHRP